ncbi:MAG: hypothetical protein LAO56_14295 [Acidobacteriia bacterium]|nr:hypothetical protein [Terriglobia bacterium]
MKSRTIAFMCVAMAVILATAISTQAQDLASLWPGRAHGAGTATAESATIKQEPRIGAGAAVTAAIADTCAYTFTNPGKNNSYMTFCVSVNGNLISFQSPSGIEYLNLGTLSEGYGICDLSTGAAYYDFSDYGESGNWNPPVLLLVNATTVKIARTTSDGLFTLTQTIAKVAGVTPYAKITMALKNNTGVTKDVYLIRWADVDPFDANSTGSFLESFDSSVNSAWGYTAYNYSGVDTAGYGLEIQNIGLPNVPNLFGGFDLNTNFPPSPCSPTANYLGYQASVDGSVEMLYLLELTKGKVGTVIDRYTAF